MARCLALGGDRFGVMCSATFAILLAFVVFLDGEEVVGFFAVAAFATCLADFAILSVDFATLMRIASASL